MSEKLTWMDEAASWHETQARRFWEMAKDDPRIDADTRMKAAGAAQHHAGSASALRVKASDQRREALSHKGRG